MIIGVLVAVSIPIFTTQLDKAKDATNTANARSIYATLVADYLDNNKIDAVPSATSWDGTSELTITIDGNSFKFTPVTGAGLTINNASATATDAPNVVYTHATKAGGAAETFGQAATSTNP